MRLTTQLEARGQVRKLAGQLVVGLLFLLGPAIVSQGFRSRRKTKSLKMMMMMMMKMKMKTKMNMKMKGGGISLKVSMLPTVLIRTHLRLAHEDFLMVSPICINLLDRTYLSIVNVCRLGRAGD